MPDPITSKEDDTRARRCFVEQFPDLGETSASNIFRDISAPTFDLLVIETNRYAIQKNEHLFTVSSMEIQKLVVFIILSACNNHIINDSPPGPCLSIPTPLRYDGKGHYRQDCLLGNASCTEKVQGSNAQNTKKTLQISTCFQLFHER